MTVIARSLLEEILYVHQKSCECGVYYVLLEREDGPVHRGVAEALADGLEHLLARRILGVSGEGH